MRLSSDKHTYATVAQAPSFTQMNVLTHTHTHRLYIHIHGILIGRVMLGFQEAGQGKKVKFEHEVGSGQPR